LTYSKVNSTNIRMKEENLQLYMEVL